MPRLRNSCTHPEDRVHAADTGGWVCTRCGRDMAIGFKAMLRLRGRTIGWGP